MEERLQKILAKAGIGSRRTCETYIEQGRVKVNGKSAIIGQKADAAKDHITFDGKRIQQSEAPRYIILNKPRNVISTAKSPDPRPTVVEIVAQPERLYPVGRLDIESEGLIFLTNDGDLANRLTHPRYGVEKEYRALVPRNPDEKQLATWQRGVVLEDGHRTAPARVWVESETSRGVWLRIVMKEGRKRQIREIGSLLGLPVIRLIRIRMGSLHLGTLKTKEWRDLTPTEVDTLKKQVEKKAPRRKKPKSKRRFNKSGNK